MLFKLILKTNLVTWLALIMSNTVLAVVMSLNIGLIVAGVRSTGETQEAYISLGSTALLLVVATSLVSLTLVTNFTLRLQHPVVAGGSWWACCLVKRPAFSGRKCSWCPRSPA